MVITLIAKTNYNIKISVWNLMRTNSITNERNSFFANTKKQVNLDIGMKYLSAPLLMILSLPILSFRNDKHLENEKYLNFLAAIENNSTFSYFTVIKVKDLNTGITKEICTKGGFISGALHRELKVDYDEMGIRKVEEYVKKRKDRYFELKDKAALHNISFYGYDSKQLKKLPEKYDFDKVVQLIKRDKKFMVGLSDTEMKYFAHLVFNKGYMTGENDCFGGRLQYVDRKNPDN